MLKVGNVSGQSGYIELYPVNLPFSSTFSSALFLTFYSRSPGGKFVDYKMIMK